MSAENQPLKENEMKLRSVSVFLATSALVIGMSGIAHADMPACKSNYTASGSMFTGKIAKTYDSFINVPPDVAYKRIYVALVAGGWRIVQSDKDIGAITALNVSGTVPFSILIQPEGSGSKVSGTLNMGRMVSSSDISTEICKPIVAADNAPSQ